MKAAITTADERQIAQELVNRFSGSMAQRLKDTYDYSSAFAYVRRPGFACAVDDYGTEKVTLDDDYEKQALDAIPEQLAKADAHIAYILNRAFAK
ncbi:hypothetical protein D3C71_965650 [compost metagenome]